MNNEEIIQEMIEQALEDALLGYRDHHTYDDAASTPVEIDYTTQSWIWPCKKSIISLKHWKQCHHMILQELGNMLLMVSLITQN